MQGGQPPCRVVLRPGGERRAAAVDDKTVPVQAVESSDAGPQLLDDLIGTARARRIGRQIDADVGPMFGFTEVEMAVTTDTRDVRLELVGGQALDECLDFSDLLGRARQRCAAR